MPVDRDLATTDPLAFKDRTASLGRFRILDSQGSTGLERCGLSDGFFCRLDGQGPWHWGDGISASWAARLWIFGGWARSMTRLIETAQIAACR